MKNGPPSGAHVIRNFFETIERSEKKAIYELLKKLRKRDNSHLAKIDADSVFAALHDDDPANAQQALETLRNFSRAVLDRQEVSFFNQMYKPVAGLSPSGARKAPMPAEIKRHANSALVAWADYLKGENPNALESAIARQISWELENAIRESGPKGDVAEFARRLTQGTRSGEPLSGENLRNRIRQIRNRQKKQLEQK